MQSRERLTGAGSLLLPALFCFVAMTLGGSSAAGANEFVTIEGGSYLPLYAEPPETGKTTPIKGLVRRNALPAPIAVKSFLVEEFPVAKSEFLDFVRDHQEWRRSAVKPIFADNGYLKSWQSDFEYSGDSEQPVTEVSWFAAKAYCKSKAARLLTTQEWEYIGRASETSVDASNDEAFLTRILGWYSRHDTTLPKVGVWKNIYGVYDLHGLVWEWVSDFNSALITGESRGDAQNERNLFCGGGAAFASEKQKRNYAAFMRFAFRSSLEGRYALPQLGFRCAKDLDRKKGAS